MRPHSESVSDLVRRIELENTLRMPKFPAILGLTLAIPLALILIVEISGVKPFHNIFVSLTTESGIEPRLSALGKVLILTAIVLVPVGLAVSLLPLLRRETRQGTAISSLDLVVSGLMAMFLVSIVTAFVIDQYPCWIGVPNCD